MAFASISYSVTVYWLVFFIALVT